MPPTTTTDPHSSAGWLTDLRRDVPYAIRALRRTPGFTALCVFTIAVGIAANAAIFSVVNTVLLRPLPYDKPDQIVRVWESLKDKVGWTGSVSDPNLHDWREQSHSIEDFVAFQGVGRILDGSTEPERVVGVAASANLFKALRAKPLIGRTFAPDEDLPGHNSVVVLSESFWRRRFAGDRSIVGRTISLDGSAHTVIGVMPESFLFPANTSTSQIWIPYTPSESALNSRGSHSLSVIARLKPSSTLESTTAELKKIAAGLETQYPEAQANRTVLMMSLQESIVGRVKPALYVLLGAVVLVLLIACANVANLLLARAASRKRDVAVRLALGASRGQLLRQYLTESVVLAVCGAVVGAFGAWIGLKPLATLASSALPVPRPISLDMPVLIFLLVVSVACGIVFGLVPAMQSSSTERRNDLAGAGNKSTSTAAQQRARGALVVAQISLSLVLLVSAGLLMRGFFMLRGSDGGFPTDHLVSLRLAIPQQLSDSVVLQQVYRPILEQTRGTVGVKSAGLINILPIDNWGVNGNFWVDGRPKPDAGKRPITEMRQVSPGYFATMGIALKAGRDLAESDKEGGGNPVLVNEAMVREQFKGENPIGKALRTGDDDDSRFTIVGVVGDVKSQGLDRTAVPELYFPYANRNWNNGSLILVVRTELPIDNMIAPLRAAVHKAAPNVPVFAIRSLDEIVGRSLASRQLNLTLLGIFAVIALVLASSGLYGVISYMVTQRTREIGIRMALGADRKRVVRMVMLQGAQLAFAGIAVGLVGAVALTQLLANMLYGVGTHDPATFTSVPLMLAIVAMFATLIPAWRASQVDPIRAIRSE